MTNVSILRADGTLRTMREIEDDIFRMAAEAHSGNLTAAALELAVSRSTMYRRLSETDRALSKSSSSLKTSNR